MTDVGDSGGGGVVLTDDIIVQRAKEIPGTRYLVRHWERRGEVQASGWTNTDTNRKNKYPPLTAVDKTTPPHERVR